MDKKSYPEPIILCKKNELIVATESNLTQYLDRGFRIISEAEAKSMSQFKNIKNLVK